MKKQIIKILTALACFICLCFGLAACVGDKGGKITFQTLTVDGKNVSGVVSNVKTHFSFEDEITVADGVTYEVARDEKGVMAYPNKIVALQEGDNTFYVFEIEGENTTAVYTVTIRRKPMYTVAFNTDGGTAIESQRIEEGNLATQPTDPKRDGYTFGGWGFDFTQAITQSALINAKWTLDAKQVFTVSDGVIRGFSEVGKKLELPTLEIPSEIDGVTITGIGDNAFYANGDFTSVTIPENVTSIGEGAFGNCYVLTSINVDGNNKNYKTIDGNLYTKDGKTLLQYAKGKKEASFTVLDGVTSIGGHAFDDCWTLTSITIPDSVTSIGNYAFYQCSGLTSITIPDGVTSIGYGAFSSCNSLTSITIPDNVKSIGNSTFSYCNSLKSITIPDGVKSIGDSAFSDCRGLTSITIPDSVTSIGFGAFSDTSYYNDESNWENGVLYIGKHLIKAKETVSGAYTVKTGTLTIAGSAFNSCGSLTSITIPDGVTNIGDYTFYNCDNLTSVTIPDGVTSIGDYAFYNCDSLTSITIPDGVTSIGDYAFSYCRRLTGITIPDSVISIGERAFHDCSSLTNINVDSNNENYKSIEDNLYTKDGKTLIQYAIGKTVTSFTIPDGVTSIGEDAFWGCSSLTSITIPDSVTSIGGSAFGGCWMLKSITVPDSVTSIGDYAFV